MQALMTHMAQGAVCNRHHTVEQQLCRWLLLTLDRLPTNQLVMTQDLVANMLGVRREGITERPATCNAPVSSATAAGISRYWTAIASRSSPAKKKKAKLILAVLHSFSLACQPEEFVLFQTS
jgi:hypothetical protein